MPSYRLAGILLLALPLCSVGQATQDCSDEAFIVSVLDPAGAPVKDLVADNFRVALQGQPAKLASVAHRENPQARVVVLLDVSGSMKGGQSPGKWRTALAATSDFLSSASPQTQITLMAFNTKVEWVFAATDGRGPIQDWLSKPEVQRGAVLRGGTAVYDAILEALNRLTPPHPGDAIYVITDGEDNRSPEGQKKILRALGESGVRLFGFLVNGPNHPEELRGEPIELDELTRQAGGLLGTTFNVGVGWSSSHDFGDDIVARELLFTSAVQAAISDFYVISIQSGDAELKHLKVNAVNSAGKLRKDLTVSYPHESAPKICGSMK